MSALHSFDIRRREPDHQALVATAWKLRSGFVTALVCLLVVGALSLFGLRHLNVAFASTARAQDVVGGLRALVAATTDAESSARGYVITGQTSHTHVHQQAIDAIEAQSRRLRVLMQSDPIELHRLDLLMAGVDARLQSLRKAMDLRRDIGYPRARDDIAAGAGEALQADLVKQANELIESQSVALRDSQQLGAWRWTLATGIVVAGTVAAAAIVILALLSLQRNGAVRRDAERAVYVARADFESRVADRTAALEESGRKLEHEVAGRRNAQQKLQSQLQRLSLLQQITRAIGERQDLQSIFQIVTGTLEVHLPVDFCCVLLFDPEDKYLTVTCLGARSLGVAEEVALGREERIEIDENGLTRCIWGQLVCEPQLGEVPFPMARSLAGAGLNALVAAPLMIETKVFGVLLVARGQGREFSSGECEFLKQLGEHVGLATHQAQLYGALHTAYEDLSQTQQAVLQQERLFALGQMASGIAHDINNAISPVTLYTEALLNEEEGLSARARRYLATIQRSIAGVAQTVANMREFYHQRDIEVALLPVNLNDLALQVVELTHARWSGMAQRKGIAIDVRTQLAPNLPGIIGFESELRDALVNLIFNAVDAMPEGGWLTLRTSAGEESLHGGRTRRVVHLEVSDTGIGMDENTRHRCMEPFFTTKGESGTGLGLAMVYGTMQRHGAKVDIESAVGAGTTLRFQFPVPAVQAAEIRAPVATPRHALHVLVIDDDPLVSTAVRDTLETDGHRVAVAEGGQTGIDAFKSAQSSGTPFDVVITDLGMPGVDGRKVSRVVKESAPGTWVVMLTGWGQRMLADGDVPSHVDRVLSKPPMVRDLRAALVAAERIDAASREAAA